MHHKIGHFPQLNGLRSFGESKVNFQFIRQQILS